MRLDFRDLGKQPVQWDGQERSERKTQEREQPFLPKSDIFMEVLKLIFESVSFYVFVEEMK